MSFKRSTKYYIFLTIYMLLFALSIILLESSIPFLVLSFVIIGLIAIYKHPKYSIFIILICTEKYLFITDSNLVLSTAFDLVLLLSILISIKYMKYKKLKGKIFSKYIILTLVLVIISIIIANIKFGQPIIEGIIASRYMFLYFLYFPLSKYVNKYGSDYLLNLFMWFGFITSLLFLIQMIIYPIIIFKLNYSYRSGNIRSYASLILIAFSAMIAFSKFIHESKVKNKIKYLLVVIIDLSELILFSQTRSLIIILGITLIFSLFTYDSKNKIKKIGLITFVCIIMLILFKDYFSELLNSAILEITDKSISDAGTLKVRVMAINYMLNQLKGNFLFGLGYYSGSYEMSSYITGAAYGYYFGDVGFFGHLFHLGILGFIVSILYYIKIAKIYKKLNKDTYKKSFFKMFLVFTALISVFNYLFAINNLIVYLLFFTCSLEAVYNEEIIESKIIEK